MRKNFALLSILILSLFFIKPSTSLNVTLIYVKGCPSCERAYEVMEETKIKNVTYNVIDWYEVPDLVAEYGEKCCPMLMIGNKVISASELEEMSKQEIRDTLVREVMYQRMNKTKPKDESTIRKFVLSPYVVFSTGFLAGLSPCTYAVWVFLVSYLIASGKRRLQMFYLLTAFCLGIFALSMSQGLLILFLFQSLPEYTGVLTYILAIFTIFLGLWYIKDYANPESRLFRTPDSVKRLVSKFTLRATLLSVFLLGFIFSLVKAPCISGVYIAIVNAIAKGHNVAQGVPLLILYNIGQTIDDFLLGIGTVISLSPKALDKFREEERPIFRLFAGILMVILGILLITGIL